MLHPKYYENDRIATVDEVLELAQTAANPRDSSSLEAIGPTFYSLHNNRSFLSEFFNREVKRIDVKRLAQYLSPQSFMLGASSCGTYAVRTNVWIPIEGTSERKAMESRIFSYGAAHSHNFSFLTAGYLGSGYRSKLYEVNNPDEVRAYVGAHVPLTYIELATLSKGSLMIYESAKDVHIQLPPDELSLSLNLLVSIPENYATPQFYIDVESERIIGFPEINTASKRLALLTMASLIGDENTLDILTDTITRTSCFRTKVGAAKAALALMAESSHDSFIGSLGFDPNTMDVSIASGYGREQTIPREIR